MTTWDEFVQICTDIDSQYDSESFEDSNDTFWDMYNAEREDDSELGEDYE